MRVVATAFLFLAVAGLALSQAMTIDTSATPTTCTSASSGGSSITCGSCSQTYAKITSDATAGTYKAEMFCKTCSNGKTPDASAAYSFSGKTAETTMNINFGAKCNAAMRFISFIAVFAAVFFHTL